MESNQEPITVTNVEETTKRVQAALEKIRPALQADGGDAEIVSISPQGVVTLQLIGACGGCSMSTMTLKQGIERVVRMEVPEIISVEAMSME